MAQKDVLTLVKSALYRSNATQIPSALVGATDAFALQITHLLYSVGEELRAIGGWPQLKRKYKVRLVAQQDGYTLPLDFYALTPFTQYDEANSWSTEGPMTDADWTCRVIADDLTGNTKAFRLFGYKTGQLKIHPTPGDGDAGSVISIEYISRSWLQPPPWTASEGSLAQNIWRSAGGILYKKTDSGSDTAGTVRPTMEFGEGQDGSVRWLAISTSAFSTTTAYAAGTYLTSGGNLYRVKVGGTTGGSAPTSTTEDTDITNGTTTLRYHSAASWTAQTDFEAGDFILISAQYYRCEEAGKTGQNQPTWSPTAFTDNTITWEHQDVAYEELVADTDFTVFDDELIIAGLRAKLFQARGLGSDDLVFTYERLKNAAKGRYNVGKVIDWAAGFGKDVGPSLAPISNWTVTS